MFFLSAIVLFANAQYALAFTTTSHFAATTSIDSNLVRGYPKYHHVSNLLVRPMSTTNDAASTNDEKEPLFEAIGKGIVRDYKGRFPLFASDITDGLNLQCIAATMFLFFACLAPAIGFGGLFASATDGAIGTIEMVSSTAACGVLYAIFSAQPLTIIGSTGPVLAFVAALFQLSKSMKLPFLPLYAWTGLWTSAILFISSLTSASNLVKYLTRFTDEIFSLLISTIFVVEAISDIAATFTSPTSTFTKALLTLVIASVSYGIATVLKGLRKSVYFTPSIRKTISNFAPTIGVVIGSVLARSARIVYGSQALLPSLSIPAEFATTSGRSWFIPIGDLPIWARFASFLPAMMATVLLFLDQNITVRLVNNPRYKMVKGRRKGNYIDGMHADMFVLSILTALQSLVGFPWLVAATVRSTSHVKALSTFDKDGTIERTMEQRVTGVAIHALIGSCVLFEKPRFLLSQVPSPVLMGLFMYLGISSLPGNEMWERITRVFQDKKIAPQARYSIVPTRVKNLFTFVQLVCLSVMLWIKSSSIGVLFPIVIAMLAPIRFALEKMNIIKKEYMDILDAE
jgi:hypothetical protein